MTWPNDPTRCCQYTRIPLNRLHWNHSGWCYHPVVSGIPLEVQVHWDATGTTVADASTQACPSRNPVIICTIGTHWNTTGATSALRCHWNHTGWCWHPGVSQSQSCGHLHNWNKLEHHWNTIGGTLETHWLPAIISQVAFQCTPGSKFQTQRIANGLQLNYHCPRVRANAASRW